MKYFCLLPGETDALGLVSGVGCCKYEDDETRLMKEVRAAAFLSSSTQSQKSLYTPISAVRCMTANISSIKISTTVGTE